MTIQHRMDGAFRWNRNAGESAQQSFLDFSRTPAGVLTLHVQDVVLHLEGQLIRVAKGTSAPVRQPLHPTFMVAIENLVARLAGNPKLPAKFRHPSPASRRATNCSLSSIAEHSFQGITPSPLRGKVSPMCPVQCVTYVSGRSFLIASARRTRGPGTSDMWQQKLRRLPSKTSCRNPRRETNRFRPEIAGRHRWSASQ